MWSSFLSAPHLDVPHHFGNALGANRVGGTPGYTVHRILRLRRAADPNSIATARQLIFKNFMFSSSSWLFAHPKDALRIG